MSTTTETYKGHSILVLPVGDTGQFKFGERKAQALIDHSDSVRYFALTGQLLPGSTASVEDYKGQPVLVLPLENDDRFKFGQRKALAVVEHFEAIQSFIEGQSPTGPASPAIPARVSENERRAQAFRKLADGMQNQIAEARRPAFAGQRSTPRRERFRASKAEDARHLEKVQNKLYALAEAWAQGKVPESLKGVTTKAVVDRLVRTERYNNCYVNANHLERLLVNTKGRAGTAEARRVVQGLLRRRQDWYAEAYGKEEIEAIEILLKKDPQADQYAKFLRGEYSEYLSLIRAGIISPETYSQAHKDLQMLGDPQAGGWTKADRIAQAEGALAGLRLAGYFPTPSPLSERVAALADIQPGQSVLEPSAGKGNLADAVRAACPTAQVDCCEIQSRLREILELKGHTIIATNFLDLENAEGTYDRVVMNPPFEQLQDIRHVRRAYEMLKPGGRMVAIMGEGAFFRTDRVAVDFRAWLEELGGTSEKLPEGAFKESGTGVAARIITINKPVSVVQVAESPLQQFVQLALF